MNKIHFALLCLCGATGAAIAQAQTPDPLGKVTEARGVVTVSDGATVGLAQQGTPFFDGTRFVSSPSGRAELRLDNGCVIRLEPNQSLVVRGRVSCEELLALVQNVQGAPVLAGTPGLGNVAALRLMGAAGAALLMADNRRNSSRSDSGGGAIIPPPPVSGQ